MGLMGRLDYCGNVELVLEKMIDKIHRYTILERDASMKAESNRLIRLKYFFLRKKKLVWAGSLLF